MVKHDNKIVPRGPIGVFDSGYGGLTILRDLRNVLPGYDYIYLGDNARAPYGTRTFDQVYCFTLEAVNKLQSMGCPLVILACNTASAKALRTIQQNDLPVSEDPSRRVLGVIRPTAEYLGTVSHTGHIGVFATPGTIASGSYDIEIAHQCPSFKTTGHACPTWVPLIESGKADSDEADILVKVEVDSLLKEDPEIDTIILGCTHYPLLYDKIKKVIPEGVTLLSQGAIVAQSLADYLRRHPEMDNRLSNGGTCCFYTTGDAQAFGHLATPFMGHCVEAQQLTI
ncbi:MAG: glutamate racemase [Muribaculaceae bacterium]|nr:glutamate racemase [Muribaculaceae bacterium]